MSKGQNLPQDKEEGHWKGNGQRRKEVFREKKTGSEVYLGVRRIYSGICVKLTKHSLTKLRWVQWFVMYYLRSEVVARGCKNSQKTSSGEVSVALTQCLSPDVGPDRQESGKNK